MMAYDANLEDETLPVVVFAGSTTDAVALFCNHHVGVRGTMPGAFYVTRRTIAQEADPAALRAALRRELAGIGIKSEDAWEIVAVGTG
jgi:hypothetical protein